MRLSTLLCLAATLAGATPALGAGPAFDVSYLWHPERANVVAYERKVAQLLGPAVAARLRVVKGSDNYGLIYMRHGARDSTFALSRRHTLLLVKHGLEPAVIIPSQAWQVLPLPEAAPAREAVVAAPKPAGPPPTRLERRIESYIAGLRRRGRVRGDERTSWSVYDFTSGKKLVSINEDEAFETASMIKPFIALAYFDAVAKGTRRYGPAERRRMELMIRDSDNASADWFLRRLGGPRAVQRRLTAAYGPMLRGLRLVEYIPLSGRTYRNKATAHDYSRFLYALWRGELPGSAEIKRVMGLPKPDRLTEGVEDMPDSVEVYDKTGTTARLCGDMGILVAKTPEGKAYPYIMVGVIQKGDHARHYFTWMRRRGDVIRGVSGLVYRYIAARHEIEDSTASTGRSSDRSGG
ncbi:MAG: serine hydrolase [Elusimicrobia bacterium]|nr:serine hydrolase [Elusimicrobiota bacterium]